MVKWSTKDLKVMNNKFAIWTNTTSSGKRRFCGIPLMMATLLLASGCNATSLGDEKNQRAGRMLVPEFIKCDRNNLTSWRGTASRYEHTDESLTLIIETDYGTQERVDFALAENNQGQIKNMFLGNRPFIEEDWVTIEKDAEDLQSNVIVTAWVCNANASTSYVLQWHIKEK
jgi:hypothetical protein